MNIVISLIGFAVMWVYAQISNTSTTVKILDWSLYTHFKKSFPFGYTQNCDYKNPLRRAFIQHWAQKHLDYIAKKH